MSICIRFDEMNVFDVPWNFELGEIAMKLQIWASNWNGMPGAGWEEVKFWIVGNSKIHVSLQLIQIQLTTPNNTKQFQIPFKMKIRFKFHFIKMHFRRFNKTSNIEDSFSFIFFKNCPRQVLNYCILDYTIFEDRRTGKAKKSFISFKLEVK